MNIVNARVEKWKYTADNKLRLRLLLPGWPFEHADAFIVGDRDSLVKLREAIDDALASGSGFAVVLSPDGKPDERVTIHLEKNVVVPTR